MADVLLLPHMCRLKFFQDFTKVTCAGCLIKFDLLVGGFFEGEKLSNSEVLRFPVDRFEQLISGLSTKANMAIYTLLTPFYHCEASWNYFVAVSGNYEVNSLRCSSNLVRLIF